MEEDTKKPTRMFVVSNDGKEYEMTAVEIPYYSHSQTHIEFVGAIIYQDTIYEIKFDNRVKKFSIYYNNGTPIVEKASSVLHALTIYFGMKVGEYLYSALLQNEEAYPRLDSEQRRLFVSNYNAEYSDTHNQQYSEWLHIYYYCKNNNLSPFDRDNYQKGKNSFKWFCGGI